MLLNLRELMKIIRKNINSMVNYYGLSHLSQFKNFKESVLNEKQNKSRCETSFETQKFIKMIYDN